MYSFSIKSQNVQLLDFDFILLLLHYNSNFLIKAFSRWLFLDDEKVECLD